MLSSTPNIYLLLLAALGWLLSLYFGFFRYRQFIWSRNKVRYDLLLKIDQRRANLASKLLVLLELEKKDRRNTARISGLLRRYLELLRQIDFLNDQQIIDVPILEHFREGVELDLQQFASLRPSLLEHTLGDLLENHPTPSYFTRTVLAEYL